MLRCSSVNRYDLNIILDSDWSEGADSYCTICQQSLSITELMHFSIRCQDELTDLPPTEGMRCWRPGSLQLIQEQPETGES